MASREQLTLAWLDSPAVHWYTDAERQAFQMDRPQTKDEARRAPSVPYYNTVGMTDEQRAAAYETQREARIARAKYRDPVPPRTPKELAALKATLSRRPAPRTDPWAGIDVNPWRITEAERKRLGLGRFR